MGVLCLSLFWCALLCVLSSFEIILKRKRELFALLLLSYGCLVTVSVLWLFLALQWVGLRCVIVVFPDHTHLLFSIFLNFLSSEIFKSMSLSISTSFFCEFGKRLLVVRIM